MLKENLRETLYLAYMFASMSTSKCGWAVLHFSISRRVNGLGRSRPRASYLEFESVPGGP